MSQPHTAAVRQPHHHRKSSELFDKASLGFWIYLMTDLVLFGTLFATYAVLHHSTAGGPGAKDLFEMHGVMAETLLLLTSSFTIGLALLAAKMGNRRYTALWLIVTMALGASFLYLELSEFGALVADGHSWRGSAFLSSFFTLVATHGAHISVGLIWIAVCLYRLFKQGLNANALRRLTLLSLFWHFLDIVWIFIFTFVYLLGVAN